MIEESNVLKELYALREAVYEERKHLSPEERAALSNRQAEAILKKYGLKLKRVTKPQASTP